MKKIGLYYGSTSGKTVGVVDEIEFNLGELVDVHNVTDGISELSAYENLILAVPSYGVGELQEDWVKVFEEFKSIDFKEKKVALVGIGNQTTFGETFVGAIKILYDTVIKNGGTIIGLTSTDGYFFKECEALVDGKFMGLVLDEENQDDLTPDRIYDWLEEIKPLFN
jgi:flavodoxin I